MWTRCDIWPTFSVWFILCGIQELALQQCMNEGSQHTQQELEQVTHKEQIGNLFMDYFNGREEIQATPDSF